MQWRVDGRSGGGDPTAGNGLELQVIAAVVLGGGSLAGGADSVLGALLGALCMTLLANGCTLEGLPVYVQDILVGAIILFAVALDRFRHRRGRLRRLAAAGPVATAALRVRRCGVRATV